MLDIIQTNGSFKVGIEIQMKRVITTFLRLRPCCRILFTCVFSAMQALTLVLSINVYSSNMHCNAGSYLLWNERLFQVWWLMLNISRLVFGTVVIKIWYLLQELRHRENVGQHGHCRFESHRMLVELYDDSCRWFWGSLQARTHLRTSKIFH